MLTSYDVLQHIQKNSVYFSKNISRKTSTCGLTFRYSKAEDAEYDTAWKVSKCWVISGQYFPLLGLNTVIYSVHPRIQSEYRKTWTRNNSVFGHFSNSVINNLIKSYCITISMQKISSIHQLIFEIR